MPDRILVVDDQKDVRAMVCMVLRVNRFEVAEADGAKAALKAFSEGSYEVLNSRIAPGGGEKMEEAAIKMLDDLKREEPSLSR